MIKLTNKCCLAPLDQIKLRASGSREERVGLRSPRTMLCAPPQQTLRPSRPRRVAPAPPRCSSTSDPGSVRRLVLQPEGRAKLDPRPDRDFYAFPRLVTHVDDAFIATLTDLYRERLRPGWDVLDLMSSWVSHLPPEVKFRRVVGHGLNAQELARNPRLDYFFVKDLNREQQLELDSASFDAVLCTVSVQYLQYPEKVLFLLSTAEHGRHLVKRRFFFAMKLRDELTNWSSVDLARCSRRSSVC